MVASDGVCELCGHYVALRQKAHIVAEEPKRAPNIMMLCPSCHVMFDVQVKPKLYRALSDANVERLPKSWKKSIYGQAADASKGAS